VNAPIIEEFPLVMECELAEVVQTEILHAVVGKVVNVSAEEAVLDEKGKVDAEKLQALMFDQFRNGYYVTGEKAGRAWNAGKDLMKKA
ncbi:MAG: flavin oxidoreductase, partial [Oscillibacter sp.]|nr:flavin oxidoreductase [Oscillibacter sp.]